MIDRTRYGRPVKIRLSGQRGDVAMMADRIESDPDVTVTHRSAPYPDRGSDPNQVRVYLDAVDY